MPDNVQFTNTAQIVTVVCAVVTAIGVPLVGVATAYVAYLMAKLNVRQKEIAERAASAAKAADDAAKAAAVEVGKVAAKQQEAAAEVREVKVTLQESTADAKQQLEGIAKRGEATHTLVNSQHGIALKTIYEQAVKLAGVHGTDQSHRDVAEAKKNLDEHERKQGIVDAKAAGDAGAGHAEEGTPPGDAAKRREP